MSDFYNGPEDEPSIWMDESVLIDGDDEEDD